MRGIISIEPISEDAVNILLGDNNESELLKTNL